MYVTETQVGLKHTNPKYTPVLVMHLFFVNLKQNTHLARTSNLTVTALPDTWRIKIADPCMQM